MEINNKIVGERIRNIRLTLGDSMERFGKRFNTSKGTVNNWEKGRNLPNKKNIATIATLGNISVEELLGEDLELFFDNEVKFYKDILDENFSYITKNPKFDKIFNNIKEEYFGNRLVIEHDYFSHTLKTVHNITLDDLPQYYQDTFPHLKIIYTPLNKGLIRSRLRDTIQKIINRSPYDDKHFQSKLKIDIDSLYYWLDTLLEQSESNLYTFYSEKVDKKNIKHIQNKLLTLIDELKI